MSDNESADSPKPQARRRGLGRGLGALIPSGPLPTAANKGHFWDALDHPPIVDADRADPLSALEVPGAAAVESAQPEDGSERAAGSAVDNPSSETPGQGHDSDVILSPADGVDNTAPSAAVLVELDVDVIAPNPKQPRQVFDDEHIDELAHSVREFGLLQPIVVRRRPEDGRFELVMGERRLRAARVAGLRTVPAILRQTADDAMLRDALLENIHRVQLNPLEEAAAYEQLLVEFDVTHEELAARIGRSRSQVSNTIRLMRLPVPVQQRVAAGVLSAGHARALLGLEDSAAQDALAKRIVAEGLSVRATEEAVAIYDGPRAAPRRTARSARITAPGLTELADNLSDTFDTRVQVQLGRRKGKVTIEFGSVDDLERIVALMAPHLATRKTHPDH